MSNSPRGCWPILRLAALTIAAILLHGYHLGVEDGEIYVPAAKKAFNPALYPYATEFFLSHGHLSIFSPLLAWTARLTHLSMDWAILAWFVVTLFAMLLACWTLASACFESQRARWCAVLVVTAVLAMPASNTGLLLMDTYLTARSFSTPLTLFALAFLLERKYLRAGIVVLLTAAIHPQMVVYLIFLTAMLALVERHKQVRAPQPVLATAAGFIPGGFHLAPATGAYRECFYARDYYFLYNWAWYHWLGLLAPLAILAWFWKGKLRGTRPAFAQLCFIMLPFGLFSIVVGLLFSSSPEFDMLARLQPLRTFHLITIVLMLLLGGVIGEYAAKGRKWVVAVVVLPLAAGMFFAARQNFPHSTQIELPSTSSSNPWVNALLWVRVHTPQNAVFALDARYLYDPDTDVHGFRAIAERSSLADYVKDGGVASLFPNLADEWKQMSTATYQLNHFQAQDFRNLQTEYPVVTWTIVHGPAPSGLTCPYEQRGYAVCQLEETHSAAAVRSTPGQIGGHPSSAFGNLAWLGQNGVKKKGLCSIFPSV